MSELVIAKDLLQQIATQAVEAFPQECCGLLAGKTELCVTGITQLTNVSRDRDRFEILPDEFHTCGARLLSAGFFILGIYHSHPNGSKSLSSIDLQGMSFAGVVLIAACTTIGVRFAAYDVDRHRVSDLSVQLLN